MDIASLGFKPSTGDEVLKCALKEEVLICNATLQFPRMYVIEWLLVQPLVFEVVDFKSTVGRNPSKACQ